MFEPVCRIAPAPLTPPVSTPAHCDTIHWEWERVMLEVIVMGPLPGAVFIARKIVRRRRGNVPVSKVVVATMSQAVIPPPDSVGLGGVPNELCTSTATVTSVLEAGAMAAVV